MACILSMTLQGVFYSAILDQGQAYPFSVQENAPSVLHTHLANKPVPYTGFWKL